MKIQSNIYMIHKLRGISLSFEYGKESSFGKTAIKRILTVDRKNLTSRLSTKPLFTKM